MSSYKFHSISFHWGENDNVGCGHAIDHVKYPLQIQLIHINKDIDTSNSYFNSKNKNNKYDDDNNNNNISIVTYLFKVHLKNLINKLQYIFLSWNITFDGN